VQTADRRPPESQEIVRTPDENRLVLAAPEALLSTLPDPPPKPQSVNFWSHNSLTVEKFVDLLKLPVGFWRGAHQGFDPSPFGRESPLPLLNLLCICIVHDRPQLALCAALFGPAGRRPPAATWNPRTHARGGRFRLRCQASVPGRRLCRAEMPNVTKSAAPSMDIGCSLAADESTRRPGGRLLSAMEPGRPLFDGNSKASSA
jgi:hypothetical protein